MESGRTFRAVAGVASPDGGTLPGYRPRAPGHGALHWLVHEHLETFLAEARARSDGDGLPRFIERELREFLTCGELTGDGARFVPLPAPSHRAPRATAWEQVTRRRTFPSAPYCTQ